MLLKSRALTCAPLATLKWIRLAWSESSSESQDKGSKQCVAPESRIGASSGASAPKAEVAEEAVWKVGKNEAKVQAEHSALDASPVTSSMVTDDSAPAPCAQAMFAPLAVEFALGLLLALGFD